MSQIYKINHIQEDTIKQIYIFSGNETIDKSNYTDSNGNSIFSEEELQNIQENHIDIQFVDSAMIHGDDTIGIIKKKIVHFLSLEISTKELYLFGITDETPNPSILYKQITQNENLILTNERMCQIMLNIIDNGCTDIETQSTCADLSRYGDNISYEEFLQIIDWDSINSYSIPIGQKLVSQKTMPFTANPYNCISIDNFIKENTPMIVTTQNSNLLFEVGNLCLNNIFMCTAEEVLTYSSSKTSINEKDMLNLYFPLLASIDNITSLTEVVNKRIELKDDEEKHLGDNFDRYNKQIALFHDIYRIGNQKAPLEYLYNTPGISAISIIIHPVYTIKFPLDILFKLIHATREIPMIKFNPGNKKENIYRLYTSNNIATNGKKIPYLYTINNNKKTLIIKLSKILAFQKRVSFYITLTYQDEEYDINCSFSENGNIHIDIPIIKNMDKPLTIQNIEDIIKISIKEPILDKIQSYLEQSGYTYISFNSIFDKNIEIQNISWISQLKLSTKINLKKYISCLSTIFDVVEGDLSKTSDVIHMRYKRVSSYNQMNAEDTFITELRKLGYPMNEVIKQLQTNFKLTQQDAQLKFANWMSNAKTETDLYENKKISIKTNVGFPVHITRDSTNNIISVKVDTINDIRYLTFINIYIDSILRLFVNKKSVSSLNKDLKLLCKGEIVTITEEEDVEAAVDKGLLERQNATINNNKLQFDDDDDEDFLDDLLGDDEDDSDESDDEIQFGDEIESDDEEDDDEESKKQTTPSPPRTPSPVSLSLRDEEKQLSPKAVSEISEAEIDLTGLPIKGAKSIFMANDKMRRGLAWKDPALFIKKGKGRYSTACPSQYSKHPIVLTSKEKEYIDSKDNTYGVNSYDESITYGSGEEKYHYICPRFWCLNDENGKQRSITLKEINEGKCGGWSALIPRTAKKIPKGGRIYEFTDQRFHRERYQMNDTENILVYKPMYPGFQEKTKHPNNLCIPCCFGRPTGLTKEAIKKGWTVDERNNKLVFKKNHGDEKDKKKFKNEIGKDIGVYDGKNDLDYMYKPVGEGEKGAGPTFERDEDGNIKLETIEGEPQERELPAAGRIKTHKDCNQSEKKRQRVPESIKKKKTITKMEEAPAWELFPLKTGQLGYLPEAVQKFFNYNQKPPKGDSNLMIKINKPLLLRKGMEYHRKQTFLSCIADIYDFMIDIQEDKASIATKLQKTTARSIEWIKNKILTHINLDNFITFQNGTLVDIFFKEDVEIEDMEQYKSMKIYKKFIRNNVDYLNKIIVAFKNFELYLKNDEIEIDYEYLWDIICTPNKGTSNGGIFQNGLNLLILQSPEDDITNKIEVICPSNHYGNEYFDNNREILILYTKNNRYEPIYRYVRKTENHIYTVTKTFYLSQINEQAPEIGRVISKIRYKLIEDCKPLPSKPAYTFKQNIPAENIIKYIKSIHSYKTSEFVQILNMNTKVIGLIITNNANDIFLPCLPSPVIIDMPFILIDDPKWIKPFDYTLHHLQNIYELSKKKIPCKPVSKIVENDIIIGIVTETNQFIPIIPEPYTESKMSGNRDENNLMVIKTNNGIKNYLLLDKEISTINTIDENRVNAVNNIRLESQLYNAFRNILRIVLNSKDDKNTIKQEFIEVLDDILIPYHDKINIIVDRIKSLMYPYVEFSDFKITPQVAVNKIFKCIDSNEETCLENSPPCLFTKKDGKCKLQIPKRNLISNNDNEIIYFAKLTDELIRYSRIRTFIFNPQTFLAFQHTSYNIKENEIILLEEILYGEYFEDIVFKFKNPYISIKNVFEKAEPATTVPYKNTFILDQSFKSTAVTPCIIDKKNIKLKWEKYLENNNIDKSGFELLEFKHNHNCTWELMTYILNDFGKNVSTENVKDKLIELYGVYLKSYQDKIESIWKKEGKPFVIHNLLTDIEGTIDLTGYYLTPFDIFLLCDFYECPCIIVSRNNIPPDHKKHIIFTDLSVEKSIYVIFGGVWNTRQRDIPPIYGIFKKHDSIKIDSNYFSKIWEKTRINQINTIEDYYKYSQIKKLKLDISKLKIKAKKGSEKKSGKPKKLGKLKLKRKKESGDF